jgi:hypothetical protein
MHRTLLCALLLTAAKADENCLEESSLLQEANTPVQVKKREENKPLAGLLESAKGFLKNGATSDVVEFADSILTELRDTLIPTLRSESEADQTWIRTEVARFEEALNDLTTSNLAVHQWNVEEGQASGTHKACRAQEKIACDAKRDCEMDLYRLWQSWVQEETDLQEIHTQIEEHFCHPDEHGNEKNGTLNSFRIASEPWMRAYITQKTECDAAEGAYDNKVPLCDVTNAALDSRSAICNTNQDDLEAKACAHNSAIIENVNLFHATWASLHASYQGITDLVYNQTQDRHQEYKTLVVVQCLLERVHELNGRPCDEETGQVSEEMSTCEERGDDLVICTDEPTLCPEYDPPPPTPPACANRDSVVGRCLPQPVPSPCSDAWIAAEMAENSVLPALPSPEFTATNPGCNAYPPCSECSPQTLHTVDYLTWITPPDSFARVDYATFHAAAESYAHTNALWGVTMDGCPRDNDNSHDYEGDQTHAEIPLVVHSVDETAAVRCCSEDGSGNLQCASTVLGVCHDVATFHDANAICREAGMRVCSQAEMQTNVCCGTGCWFNHFAVWISDAPAAGSALGVPR